MLYVHFCEFQTYFCPSMATNEKIYYIYHLIDILLFDYAEILRYEEKFPFYDRTIMHVVDYFECENYLRRFLCLCKC